MKPPPATPLLALVIPERAAGTTRLICGLFPTISKDLLSNMQSTTGSPASDGRASWDGRKRVEALGPSSRPRLCLALRLPHSTVGGDTSPGPVRPAPQASAAAPPPAAGPAWHVLAERSGPGSARTRQGSRVRQWRPGLDMAAGPHPHLKSVLPSFLSSRPPHSSQEQLCFPATTRPQADHLLCLGLKPAPRELPASARHASPQPGRLRSPPRSSVYLIIGLQNELTKCGILKNMSDYEDFWKLIREEAHGTEIKEKLQKIKVKMLDPRYWPLAAPRRRETRSLVNADQDKWPCQGKWIQTSSLEPVPCPSQTQEEFQQLLPRDLLSRLTEWRKRCQQRETAARLPQGQGRNKIVCKMNEKDSQSKIYLRRLRQMYSTSLANMEFSRKLLEKDGRFADMYTEGRAGGLMDYMVPSEHTEWEEVMPRETETGDPLPTNQQPRTQLALTFLKSCSSGCTRRDSPPKKGGHRVALHGMLTLSKHLRSEPDRPRMTAAPDVPAPLTLEHMTLTHRVVETTPLGSPQESPYNPDNKVAR
ncbi:PREDICTED: uncharacterized protein LOC102027459 isoform X3 [Chinchilla lanigera]|uniref:uncharacterized protein LOC102027459 isoform X3 n=1 Tax=Chinchilla lanigera TaxID=34839 RepID=UPI00038EAB5A|nr:PREDICTED: uncharacterized protein LOC102027459 isoform X3 [Chinchilla lanigera]XP_005390718.1 PREDICTED: uncharacterized protein LOC102027459 isoform X3 [Chinchilla lanigera]